MWPSMQSSRSTKEPRPAAEISSASMARREWERDLIMEELLSVSGISGISRSDPRHPPVAAADDEHGPDADDEIDALFSPYDFNSNAHFGGPSPLIQATAAQKERLVASPTEMAATASPFGLHAAAFGAPSADARQVSLAFEDDFTVFVSAPAEDVANAGAGAGAKPWGGLDLDLAHAGFVADDATPLATAFADSVVTGDSLGARNAGLTPVRAQGRGRSGGLSSYRALGSVSDFGGDEAERRAEQALGGSASTDDEGEDGEEEWEDAVDDGGDESWGEDVDGEEEEGDDDDAEMPTQGEILATAARIFGGAQASGNTFRTAGEVNRAAQAQAAVAPSAHGGGDADADADADPEDDTLGPAGPIDIEHVLRSLQGLRTEIAGVEDEEERRRMAARVALGFVYGMDLEKAASGAAGGR